MKTSVNMVRKLDVFDVIQRTKDSMFNATVLMEQWNEYSGQKKNINHYLDNTKTKEFITALIDDDLNIRKSERPVDQIKELHELEQKLAYAVDMNLITSYTQLIQVLRDTYNKKHPRF